MPPVDIRQRAISLIEQLPQNKLAAVVQLLEILTEPTSQNAADAEESHLLKIIQRRLPETEQARLDELRDRCEWGDLSEAEHQELIRYEDRLEQHRVERLEALMELARLRNLDLLALNQQVSASHPSNAA
ncbi:hypothetical protein IQ273_07520 [Nodosilinea sp. LEGE 07298]|uniref:hypothetical protein n=1 Tax=Nodosilinea sp. LEGE 07298 TaxID=2777970 RepID=UPI00187E7741|nr:hypothetical protein [Nodosilinea sp. LEGE 07298]MBE9109263.1 hypothetical protein [Nodosilinea sp. LEGE 07298]